MEEILVSVWCVTYNHELYIRDAIEGFLAQKTNFRYEILIHDDASTDKTPKIIREYEKRYPDLIHGIYETENQYSKTRLFGKWLQKLEMQNCKGKYIAVCEGDDYWIDRYKLQVQVDHMENHPECLLSIHNALKLNCQDETMRVMDPYDGNMEKDISSEELIMQYKGHPPTASMLYRNIQENMPDFFYEAPVGDYTRQLYMFTKGKIHYSSRIMSVYRYFSKDSYSKRLTQYEEMAFSFNMGMLLFLIQFDVYTGYEHHKWMVNKIQTYASAIINSVNTNILLENYFRTCKNKGYYFMLDSEKYLKKLEKLRRQVFDEAFCSDALKSFVKEFDNIVVMGKGAYSKKIVKQFELNKIEFEGFAVSQKEQEEEWFFGKPVWKLSQLPFDREQTGVVIAINPVRWDDILKSLEKADIKHYICPFLLEI